jgi:tRNA A-37 threonylcarbamoyl transferase component Bud32
MSAWDVGRIVADRYHLERRLGAGAMGEVFLAHDHLLRKEVALKVLRDDLAENRAIFKRFLREVALAHSVTHPNVVRIYDTGEAHGLPYLSMEYLRGPTLEELITESLDQELPPMTLGEIRETAEEILAGLAAAHEAGVIHRDLKPANVMLTRRGATVMDFGVAGLDTLPNTRMDPAKLDSLVRTEAGTIFGSPAYMAPELWEGAPASISTDIYSFGVMLYQMLTGRLPYDAPNARLFLEKLRTTKPTPVRNLRKSTPWNLALLVDRCMDHDPERRPRSAEAAARLVAPLSRARRAALASTFVLGTGAMVGAMVFDPPDPWEQLGLPDALARADMLAAVRLYDAGDHAPALRLLNRVGGRAPRSAGVHFWRSLIYTELRNPSARLESCGEGGFEGERAWIELAQSACAPSFSLSPSLRETLDGRGVLSRAFMAIAVEHDLVPRLESVRDAGPLLQHEVRVANQELAQAPHWHADEVALPLRWELSKIRLQVATGHLEAARQAATELVGDNPGSPLAQGYAAWLLTSLGQRDSARAWADANAGDDPRASLRLALDEGRLREAGRIVDESREGPLYAANLELWCGYAFRYEIPNMPPRCQELPPGLGHAMWSGGANEEDFTALEPHERALLDAQRELNLGRCLDRAPKVRTLTHIPPPFSTYLRQLEVGAALCAHEPGQGNAAQAGQLSETLTALDPEDPWANLIEAQVDASLGRESLARSRRNLVAERWAGADPDLPLVARLRQRLAPSPLPAPPPEAEPSNEQGVAPAAPSPALTPQLDPAEGVAEETPKETP